MAYITLDIEFARSTLEGSYDVTASIKGVSVAFKDARYASATISLELFQEWKTLNSALVALNARTRGFKEENDIAEFGNRLFEQAIIGDVRNLYRQAIDYCTLRQHTLRLRFHLGSRELVELPWEFLWENDSFLLLNKDNPRILVTRCLKDVRPIRSVEHVLPLQVLFLTAEPKGYEANAKEELAGIRNALEESEAKRYVLLREARGTNRELETISRNETLDVLHFIGHGAFNEETQQGELILEAVDGSVIRVPAFKFFMSLPKNMKLIFLNACESAREDDQSSFASIAYLLAKHGHAVVAMQFQISINAAVRFANVFYEEIAKGEPVDQAVSEARQKVFTMADNLPLDWAAPVLYMKSQTGILFNLKIPITTPVPDDVERIEVELQEEAGSTSTLSPRAEDYCNQGNAQFELKHYEEALENYHRAVMLDSQYGPAYDGKVKALIELKRFPEAKAIQKKAKAILRKKEPQNPGRL